jgi:hypothetical protein
MIPLARSIGHAGGGGSPVRKSNGQRTTGATRAVNQVAMSVSSPRLTSRFQVAWRPAERRTRARTREGIHMLGISGEVLARWAGAAWALDMRTRTSIL